MANPFGSHQEPSHGSSSINGNGLKPENSAMVLHNPDVAVEWTTEEQTVLEDGLTKYVSVPNIIRYAKIAMSLPNKTVRDVALRCRWMTKKENGKRRKETRKGNEKKERASDHSVKPLPFTVRQNVPPHPQPVVPNANNDDGISYQAIGGPMGELLRQNALALAQISANIHAFQIQENINLFLQARNNFRIMDRLNEMPNIMMQMPPLPVTINEELANYILLAQS